MNNIIKKFDYKACLASVACFTVLALISQGASAGSTTIGTMASAITSTFTSIGLMVTGGSYLAGVAFAIGAIMKFKQHKDNPTQIQVGTPAR